MRMKKIGILFAVCFALVLLASLTFAQVVPKEQPKAPEKDPAWKIYLESETKRYYFSPASVQRIDKAKVQVWEKIANKTTDGEVDTLKSLMELDCASSKYRVVATKEFDPATGADKPEIASPNEPWQYFSLESVLGVLYDNVCYKHGVKIQKLQSIPSLVAPPKEEKK
jgi:hypothetical protein